MIAGISFRKDEPGNGRVYREPHDRACVQHFFSCVERVRESSVVRLTCVRQHTGMPWNLRVTRYRANK